MTSTPIRSTPASTSQRVVATTAEPTARDTTSHASVRDTSPTPTNDRISVASTSARPRGTLPGPRAQAASSTPAIPLDDLSAAERGMGVRVALDAPVATRKFPQTLGAWSRQLADEKSRPTDPGLAAQVLNEIRNKGLGDLGQTHGQAMALVGDHHVAQWRDALGLSPADVARMRSNARTIGRFVPTSSTLFNVVNFGVLPWLTLMGSKTPMVNAGIAVASAGVAQPAATTLIQTPVIAALDTWRKKMGHAVALDGAVNAKQTPEQVAKALEAATSDVARLGKRPDSTRAEIAEVDRAIHDVFAQMAATYGAPAGPSTADAELAAHSQHLLAQMEADPDRARQDGLRSQLIALGHRRLESQAAAEHLEQGLAARQSQQKGLSDSLRMSVGMLDRQKRSTKAQEWTRILRAASGLVTVAGKGIEKAVGSRPTLYPTAASVGLAAAALMAQHFAAGRDEQVGASDVEEKLNMLYGRDYLTETGQQALVDGTPLRAEHVKEDGLRKLASGPATQMLAQVTRMVALHRSLLDADDPAQHAAVQAVDGDLAALAEGRLDDVAAGGEAHKLLHEVMAGGAEGHPFRFAAREGWNKMTSLEMSAQLGQRLGLAWLGLALGNVGATAISRVITAALGGPGVASLPAQFGAALLATASGVTNAKFAWMPVPIKNERRAEPERVGFMSQLGNSLVAPAWAWRQSSRAASALAHAAGATAGHSAPERSEAEMQALVDAMPGAFGPADPDDDRGTLPR